MSRRVAPTERGLERGVLFRDAVVAIAITLLILPMVDAARALAARRDLLTRRTLGLRPFTPPEETAELVMVLVDGRINGFHGAVLTLDEGRTAGFTSQ